MHHNGGDNERDSVKLGGQPEVVLSPHNLADVNEDRAGSHVETHGRGLCQTLVDGWN